MQQLAPARRAALHRRLRRLRRLRPPGQPRGGRGALEQPRARRDSPAAAAARRRRRRTARALRPRLPPELRGGGVAIAAASRRRPAGGGGGREEECPRREGRREDRGQGRKGDDPSAAAKAALAALDGAAAVDFCVALLARCGLTEGEWWRAGPELCYAAGRAPLLQRLSELTDAEAIPLFLRRLQEPPQAAAEPSASADDATAPRLAKLADVLVALPEAEASEELSGGSQSSSRIALGRWQRAGEAAGGLRPSASRARARASPSASAMTHPRGWGASATPSGRLRRRRACAPRRRVTCSPSRRRPTASRCSHPCSS